MVSNPLGLPAAILDRLGEIVSLLGDVRSDTKCLPSVNDHLKDVAEQTAVLHRMDARIAQIEAAMPALVEVQQHLADLPETIQGLDRDVSGLAAQIDRLMGSLEELDRNMGTLTSSVEPVARFADRMPGGNKR